MTLPKATCALVLVVGIFASHSVAAETTSDEAKQIVLNFYTMAFVNRDPMTASHTYIGPVYIQHNSRVPNGAASFEGYFEKFFQQNPTASSSIKRVIADGDLVAIHSHSKMDARDQGKAIVDIFRVKNGKIVEHWDVIQDVPTGSAIGNTMFDGDNTR